MRNRFPHMEVNMGVSCDQGAQSRVKVVIVHETQGSTAEGAVATLKSRSDGSAHVVTGPDARKNLRRIRLANDFRILCHTGGQNVETYGVEKVGISAWKKAFRLASKVERDNISLAAFETANVLRRHKLGTRYLSVKKLKTGNDMNDFKGWTYHRNASYAFGTTSHTDPGVPGVSWPHGRFKRLVRFYYFHPTTNRVVTMREVRKWERSRRKSHE